MEKYKIQKTIGSGSFANVSKALNTKTNEIVAIKKMKKKFSSWDECLNLREIKSLTKLNHPNIMKVKEVIRVNDELFCVFEFCDQNIYQHYLSYKESGQSIPEQQIKQILYQTIAGLAYMHKHGFFHRDLKPENILYSKGVIKIGDFGLAREIRSRPPYTDYVATRWYRAPEILLKSTNYNSPVDIYAIGCILAELYLLNPLFSGSSELDQLHKICSVLGTPSQASWSEGYRLASQMGYSFPHYQPIPLGNILQNASSEAVHLISGMLSFDPAKRPTAMQILTHPYLAGIAQLFPGTGGLVINNSTANIDKKVLSPATLTQNPNSNNLNPSNNVNLQYSSSSEEEELVLTPKDPFKKNPSSNNLEECSKFEEKPDLPKNKEVWRGENNIDFISEEKKRLVINEPKMISHSSTNLDPIPTKPFLIKEKEASEKINSLYDEEVRIEKENNLNLIHSSNNINTQDRSPNSIRHSEENQDGSDEEDEIKLESQPIYIPISHKGGNQIPKNNNSGRPANLDMVYPPCRGERNVSLERKERGANINKNSSSGRDKEKEKIYANEGGGNNNMFLPKLKPSNFPDENLTKFAKNNAITQNLPSFDVPNSSIFSTNSSNNPNAKPKFMIKDKGGAMKLPNLPQNGLGMPPQKPQKYINNTNNVNMPSLNPKKDLNLSFSPLKQSKEEDFIGKYKL